MWSVFTDMIVLAVRALLVPQADNRACDDVTIPRQITCGYQRPPWSVDDLEFSLDIRYGSVYILHLFPFCSRFPSGNLMPVLLRVCVCTEPQQ